MKTLSLVALAAALFLPVAAWPAEITPSTPSLRCSVEQGLRLLEQGQHEQAIRVFTCVIECDPASIRGYQGRIEAELMLGRYSDALRDFARMTAFVVPVHPEAHQAMLDDYAARLAEAPGDIRALTGASFLRWADFQYPQAIQLLDRLVEVDPDGVYGDLFRGSSRLLKGLSVRRGLQDLERALALAPESPDVRFIVADAFTYGQPDLNRAFAEASLALEGGLDTPRVHAILAACQFAFGDGLAGAGSLLRHIDLVTVERVGTAPLPAGASMTLPLVPGRVFEIPVEVAAGEVLSISTGSHDYWDSIAVLLAPDGTPVTGSDDASGYFAAFDWVAPAGGTYRLRVTFFESVNSGDLKVSRERVR